MYFYPRPPGGGRPPFETGRAFFLFLFLSTPSGWRATFTSPSGLNTSRLFLSTPSGWRATSRRCWHYSSPSFYFYPRPPGGGRPKSRCTIKLFSLFLSTPSGWRATLGFTTAMHLYGISIHALRVEGDRYRRRFIYILQRFLSTPSGWRATNHRIADLEDERFLSTPSGWRATRTTRATLDRR